MSETASLERTFAQADFDAFAALSGDDNPIHVDPQFAARSRFGRTVAHGLLVISVLGGLVQRLAPGQRLTAQDIRFPAPTYAGDAMRFEADLTTAEAGRRVYACRVVRVADGVVTCDGRLTVGSGAAA